METKVKRGRGRPIGSKNKTNKVPIKILTPIVERISSGSTPYVKFRLNDQDYYNGFNVYPAPTNNCQIFSVASFDQLRNFTNRTISNNTKLNYEPILSTIRRAGNGKRIMLIDVNASVKSFVKKVFKKEEIISEQPYRSTNGHNMCIYLIKMTNY